MKVLSLIILVVCFALKLSNAHPVYFDNVVNCDSSSWMWMEIKIPPYTCEVTTSFNPAETIRRYDWKDIRAIKFKEKTSFLPNGIGGIFPNLVLLDARFNSVCSINEETFKGMKFLEVVLLTDNRIIEILNGPFQDLENLRILNLCYNAISTIESGVFAKLQSLKYLYLNNNQITNIEHGTFHHLPSLVIFEISHNKITKLERRTLEDSKNLRIFNLKANKLELIDVNAFETNLKLELLSLDYNFPNFELAEFQKLTNLKYLSLNLNHTTVLMNNRLQNNSLNTNVIYDPSDRRLETESKGTTTEKSVENQVVSESLNGCRELENSRKRMTFMLIFLLYLVIDLTISLLILCKRIEL